MTEGFVCGSGLGLKWVSWLRWMSWLGLVLWGVEVFVWWLWVCGRVFWRRLV